MIQKIILEVYNRTRKLIEADSEFSNANILTLYKNYLTDKYENQINDILDCEMDLSEDQLIDAFVEDEVRIWTGLNELDKLSLLERDFAYEHLQFLSEVAFEQARECYDNKKYYENDDEYMQRLNEVAECLDKIKPHNIASAKEILSETVLDIEYVFGKTEMLSLRLSRIV